MLYKLTHKHIYDTHKYSPTQTPGTTSNMAAWHVFAWVFVVSYSHTVAAERELPVLNIDPTRITAQVEYVIVSACVYDCGM